MLQTPPIPIGREDEYQKLCIAVGHLFLAFANLEGALSAALRIHLTNRLTRFGENYEIGIQP
jgi:hypothetical protein